MGRLENWIEENPTSFKEMLLILAFMFAWTFGVAMTHGYYNDNYTCQLKDPK